jgi:hypothetical protein
VYRNYLIAKHYRVLATYNGQYLRVTASKSLIDNNGLTSTIQFRFRAFDTFSAPPGATLDSPIRLFGGSGPESTEKVTDRTEGQIADWLVASPPACELLLEELGLGVNTFVQTSVIEPLIERHRRKPPGDIDLILVPEPHRAIAIQIRRIRVLAETTHRDSTPGRQLGNVTKLIEQASGSREIGVCANYALVLVECYGPARSEHNFIARGSSAGVFRRIYHLTKDQPLHSDVGLIFVEIIQPTRTSVDRAAVVAICMDKPAIELVSPSHSA